MARPYITGEYFCPGCGYQDRVSSSLHGINYENWPPDCPWCGCLLRLVGVLRLLDPREQPEVASTVAVAELGFSSAIRES